MSKLDEFLAGERLDDVALFLTHEFLDEQGRIANYGEPVENGVVLVVPGDEGRQMFAAGTGMDAMEFAQTATGTRGAIDPDLGGGDCPAAGDGETPSESRAAEASGPGDGEASTDASSNRSSSSSGDGEEQSSSGNRSVERSGDDADADHGVEFVFAFAEEQNEEVGGRYAEGDVIHAYAHCACGENYSQKWVVGEHDGTRA